MTEMPNGVAEMPFLPHGKFSMPCLDLAVVPLKESCNFPHLKLHATQQKESHISQYLTQISPNCFYNGTTLKNPCSKIQTH